MRPVVFCRGYSSTGHVQACRNWLDLLLRVLTPPQTPLASGKGGIRKGRRRQDTVKGNCEIRRGNFTLRKEKFPEVSLSFHRTVSSHSPGQTAAFSVSCLVGISVDSPESLSCPKPSHRSPGGVIYGQASPFVD